MASGLGKLFDEQFRQLRPREGGGGKESDVYLLVAPCLSGLSSRFEESEVVLPALSHMLRIAQVNFKDLNLVIEGSIPLRSAQPHQLV